jgi:hypothetical protein
VGDHAASAAGSCDWRHGCQGSDRRNATAKLRMVLAGEIDVVLKDGCSVPGGI